MVEGLARTPCWERSRDERSATVGASIGCCRWGVILAARVEARKAEAALLAEAQMTHARTGGGNPPCSDDIVGVRALR